MVARVPADRPVASREVLGAPSVGGGQLVPVPRPPDDGLRPGDVDVIRRLFLESLADDGLGMRTRRRGEQIVFAYPVAVLIAARTASAATSPPRTQSGMPMPR